MNPRSTGYADPVMLLCAVCERTIIVERQHATPRPPNCPFHVDSPTALEVLAPLEGSDAADPDCILCAAPTHPPVLILWEGAFLVGFLEVIDILQTGEGQHVCDRHVAMLDGVCRKRFGFGFMRYPAGHVRAKGGAA